MVPIMMPGWLRLPLAAALATASAALCLGPVFLTGRWFFPTMAGILAVGVGSEVARRLSMSRLVVPLGGLIALAAYLLLRYGQDQALLGVLPWTDSVAALRTLGSAGRADIARYAAPVGVSPGIELLTVGGIGLVALVVDTLAVTWRRAALAGLPLLVLYTVPTAIAPDGVSWVAFALAGIAFLALLLTESRERMTRWGRPMRFAAARDNWAPQAETAALGQVGRRVGATALGLALVVPAVLPDVTASSFGFGSGGFGSGGGGGNKVEVLNPILTLGDNLRQGANTPVIRYEGRPTYFRLVGLDEFTGAKWQPSELEVSRDENDVEDGLARPPGLSAGVATTRRRYDVQIFNLDQAWLPLPYPTSRVRDIDGTWLYDPSTFNVFGENSSTARIAYGVTALAPQFTAEQLRSAAKPPPSVDRYLDLPATLGARVEATARDVVGESTLAYDRAIAIQAWLRDPDQFTYSQTLDSAVSDGNGEQAILGFIDTRSGYCVQFASTMAVMARTLGIPARVAVGFAAGDSDEEGRRVIGINDAHAWPELYFQGAGWVPFEPTPAGPASAPPRWAREQPADGGPSGGPDAQPTPTPSASAGLGGSERRDPTRGQNDPLNPAGANGGPGGGLGAGPVRVAVLPLLIALGVLALLAVPGLTRVVVRRRRWARATTPATLAIAAWTELADTLVDHGYSWERSESPRRGAERLVTSRALDDEAAVAVRRLAAATEQARYAPEMAPVGDLRSDVDVVRQALGAGGGRWAHARAVLLPRSTRAVATALSERLADGLDAVDSVLSRLGTRVRPRRS